MASGKAAYKEWQDFLNQARNSVSSAELELKDETEVTVAEILAEGNAQLHPPDAVIFKDHAGRIWVWQPDHTGAGIKDKSKIKPGTRLRLEIYEIPRQLLVKFMFVREF